jgi:glycosyltransferase involved in cell wall biosynthesis
VAPAPGARRVDLGGRRLYAAAVRFLLANNHCISDPTAGVTHSLRTIVEWLADAGHACHVLTTARFESPVRFTIEEHLASLGVALPPHGAPFAQAGSRPPAPAGSRAHGSPARSRRARSAERPVIPYRIGNVPVTLLLTRHNDEARPDRAEARQYEATFVRLLDEFAPDQLIACNGHPMIQRALEVARARGVTTVFAVRGFGYDHPRYFAHVDHVLTCSQFLTDRYRERIGLESTPIDPPIDWARVVAPSESRAFVTFVHPAPHKGLMLFARLADMLGSRRPDIPVLVIQSGHSAGALNAIAGLDFTRYPQIMAAPAVPTPADYLALTRILLVPSVWEEPFGRVAAEAMINGIPPLVGNRGALPHVVGGDAADGGGGRVLPIPEWMTVESTRLPSEQDVQPWFDAICALWDDAALYDLVARRARQIAEARYSEDVSRRRHVDYFTSRAPRQGPITTR